jgi:membrane fusion protein, multidrug efflux system
MEGSIGHRTLTGQEATREVLVLRRWPGWLGMLRWLVMLGLATAVIFGGLQINSYLQSSTPKPRPRGAAERAFPVDSQIVKRQDVVPVITSYGEVTAGRTVDLRSLVAGEVASVSPNLVEGGIVKEGETLLQIDPFNYQAALVRARSEKAESIARQDETTARIASERQGLKRAQEQLALAEREIARFETLRRSGSASNAQLDAAQLRQSNAAAAVDLRSNGILVLEAQARREAAPLDRLDLAIANAERDLANSTLKAPFAGIVSNAGAENGKLLSPNDRVATLVAMDKVDVRFTLGDAQFGRLVANGQPLQGRSITAIWQSGGSEFTRKGMISRVAPLANARDGGFDVYAGLLPVDSGAAVWRPAAFVKIIMEDRQEKGVFALPQSAVFPGGLIYRVGEDARLIEVKAELRGYDGANVLVSADLPDGSEILMTRLSEAGPGVLVAPRGRAKPTAQTQSPDAKAQAQQ